MGFFTKTVAWVRNVFLPENKSGDAVDATVAQMLREKAKENGYLEVNGKPPLKVISPSDSTDNLRVIGPNNGHVLDDSREINTFGDSGNFGDSDKDSGKAFSMAPAPSPGIDLSAYKFPLNNKHKAQFAEMELKDKNGNITPAIRISIAANLGEIGGKETIIRLAIELKKYDLKIEPIATKDGGKTDIGHDYAKDEFGNRYDPNNPKPRKNSKGEWTTEPYHPESYRVTVSGDATKLDALLAELNKQSVRPFKEKIAEDRQNSVPQR
jgi:hypothetical protein